MRPFLLLVSFIAAFASVTSVAFARPVVSLKLVVAIVQKDASGKDVLTPANGNAVHPGDRLHYEIVATNSGDKPATLVRPSDLIPNGTEFIAHTASGTGKVEYSLDRGTSWSAAPTVIVHAKDGDKVVPADPVTYSAVRWTTSLAPGASSSYAFDVLVK